MSAQSTNPIPKRIIICCDGSWQSSVNGEKNAPSNVTRLARSLERVATDTKNKIWQQIVWYDSGVGTSGKLDTARAVEYNVIEAYNFVVLNWTPGDQIFCFGFSRGAYTARSIAGLISDIGICEPRNMHHFPEIWELYKNGKAGERFYGSDEYFDWVDGKRAATEPTKWEQHPHGDWAINGSRAIEVVGVFDTVGALRMPNIHGWNINFGPDKTGYHNVKLNRNVRHAFQAIALDERREAFSPTLWHLPTVKVPTPEEIKTQQRLVQEKQERWYAIDMDPKISSQMKLDAKLAFNGARRELFRMEENQMDAPELLQVWFPGMHVNMGGGSTNTLKDKGDLEEMSNITYMWLLDQIRPYLGINQTIINQEARERQNHIDELNEQVRQYRLKLDAEGEAAAKATWTQWLGNLAHSATSYISAPKAHNPNGWNYGWGTGPFIETYTSIYKVFGAKLRTPGDYSKETNDATPGDTFERIHPTVGYRMFATRNIPDDKLPKQISQAEKQRLREELKYQPLGENKVIRRQNKQGSWEYVINGITVPEYKIRPAKEFADGPSFERLAIQGMDAMTYVNKLDKENGYPTGW